MKTFQEMDFPESLAHTLNHMDFKEPTPVQAQAIPLAIEGRDILGSAQTGTGKTGAFGIPLVLKLITNPDSFAIVMTPTRELATQVMGQISAMLGKKTKIRSALLIGGESIQKQLTQLKNKPRVIVGTPGRINDHLNRKSLKLDSADFLVLDETDRMLDMGFTIQIENVLKFMPNKRQTLLFSATLPANIVRISKKYLTNPARVDVSDNVGPPISIKQDILRIKDADKYPNLLSQLKERNGSIIIFVKTKSSTEKLAKKLSNDGFSTDAIHGDLRQSKRERVLRNFRNMKYRILVATDVAARGLDIPHIQHVINYDIPQCADDYIHRIGRTARAGADGGSLVLVTQSDKSKWKVIEKILNFESNDFNTNENIVETDSYKPKQRKRFKFKFKAKSSSFQKRKTKKRSAKKNNIQ